MKKIVPLFLLAAFVTGCATVKMDNAGVQEAQTVKSGFLMFKKAVDDVGVSGSKKSVKNKTKVVVPFFRVSYVINDKYRNSAGTYSGKATAKVNSSLSGVNGATYQQITEEIYADFIGQLKKAGFEVLPNETLDGIEKYSKLKREYPVIKDDVVQTTPQGLPFPGTWMDPAARISKDVDALVLKADLNVDYLIINKDQNRFNIMRDASAVDVTQGINVLGTVTIYASQKPTILTIQQPVTSARPFGTVLDETSAMNRAADVMVAASGWLTSQGLGSKRQSTRTYNVEARDADYRLAAGDALVVANRKVSMVMQGLAGVTPAAEAIEAAIQEAAPDAAALPAPAPVQATASTALEAPAQAG